MSERAIRYRVYPTTEQCVLFAKTFGCCRKVWNLMLSDRQKTDPSTGKHIYHTPAWYKKDYPYLREVDSLALANVQINLDTAFKNCYGGHNTEPPKFKSKRRSRKSYTTNCQAPKGGQPTIRVNEGMIHLPIAGDVKAVIHRKADPSWKLKSATVSQDSAGDYYISVLYEYQSRAFPIPVSRSLKAVGLDYKSDGLYVDSDGYCPDPPKRFRESQDKLAKAQRILSRRQGSRKGEAKSNNWYKQQRRVNKIYRHAANQRFDQLQKLSTEITNQYDVVCVETLNMKAMSNKGFGNGKATMDNGYGMFVRMLEYKLQAKGGYLIRVDQWYPSSQLCHMCGHRQSMPLSVRTYVCPDCGMVFDRDHNAAINIMREGMGILTGSTVLRKAGTA